MNNFQDIKTLHGVMDAFDQPEKIDENKKQSFLISQNEKNKETQDSEVQKRLNVINN